MSSSTVGKVNSRPRNLLDRLSALQLPSPPVVIGLLILCVFILRLPSALVPHEFDPDEGQAISQAMRFAIDPRPFIAVEGGSWGPLNSYVLSGLLWLGFKPGFVLAHILASVLVCLQVLVVYLTISRLKSKEAAAIGALMVALLYGFTTAKDYLHYAGEWLPGLLLMSGFYVSLVWLDGDKINRWATQLALLFSAGLLLGTAPWCKLQAAPITAALGLFVVAAILRDRGSSFPVGLRVNELVAFCTGSILTTCIMLVILARIGAISEFRSSYLGGNLAYAGSPTMGRGLENFIVSCLEFAIHEPLIIAFVGIGLMAPVHPKGEILLFLKKKNWAFGGLLIYAGAALFAIYSIQWPFLHHSIFLLPPMTYLVVLFFSTSPHTVDLESRHSWSVRRIFGAVIFLAFAAIGAVRYVEMIRAIRQSSQLREEMRASVSPLAADRQESPSHKLQRLFAGSMHWTMPDSSERISAVVRDIQRTHPVRSLAIWGWAPAVYVLTGIPPATRYSVAPVGIKEVSVQRYYWKRFLDDLRYKPPDLFIDAVAPNVFMWRSWTDNDGYESDPELRTFIDDNYRLIASLTLVPGAKPVRFYLRRTWSSTLAAPAGIASGRQAPTARGLLRQPE